MTDLQGRKVLVTGAGGFIGSHLVEGLLADGAPVRAFVHYNGRSVWGRLDGLAHPALEFFPGDIVDPMAVARAVTGCDMVFHLAALIAIPYAYVAPYSHVQANVVGTLNVLEAARGAGVRRECAAGGAQLDVRNLRHGELCAHRRGESLQGQSPYSASKIGADKLAESYPLSFGLQVATLRPFNTYGQGQSARAVIPTVICQLLAGLQILRRGALTPVRDFNFVDDTVVGFVALACTDGVEGEVVNIGSGLGVMIGETVAMIQQLLGASAHVVTDSGLTAPYGPARRAAAHH